MANKKIKVGFQSVGEGCPVFFISEIGINHNGDLQIAKQLIDAAFATNWDCVKFQKRTPDLCVPESQKNVPRETPWGTMTYLDYKKHIEFNAQEYEYIDQYCGYKPILWTASVWDIPSVDFISAYHPPFLKIPSAKVTDLELIEYAARTKIPIFMSTGMSTYEEIDDAVNILEQFTKGNYVLLHTNSAYPAPLEDLNMELIGKLRERYNCIVGYSGHEQGLEPTVIANYLGAKVIERHTTINHNAWGSDQLASLEVEGMDKLIKRCREVDTIRGDGEKRISGKELEMKRKLRG
ncbi:MAG: N-acetylneuraminate synthase family protein [Candidatus Nanoarchaeia archaeon]|nr:N-acetylneuraminate synthase family protein [Candidatus Nanoarchaeia archaeon]